MATISPSTSATTTISTINTNMSGVNNINTALTYQQNISNINSIQSTISNLQNQISSGQNSATFQELSQQVPIETILNLQVSLNKINSYNTNNLDVSYRMDLMDTALEKIIKITQQIYSDLTSKIGIEGDLINLNTMATEVYLPVIQDSLNTSYGDRYLFAGSKTSTKPVNIVNNTNNQLSINSSYIDGVITSNYYQGDDVILAASVSDTLTIPYGITADNTVFVNLIGTICEALAVAGDSNETNLLDGIIGNIQQSLQDLTQLRASLGYNMVAIENVNDNNTISQLNYNNIISQYTSTDIPTAMINFYQNTTILNAAFMVLSKADQLSLVNYL